MSAISPSLGVLLCLAISVPAVHAAAQVASNTPRETFTANAVNISNVGVTGARPLDIVIERWSTDAERDELFAVFKEKGSEALLEAIQRAPRVGFIRTPGSLAHEFRYARETQGQDGSRQITMVTDRPIEFWEAVSRPPSRDYPFTLIQLQVDKDGRGEGTLSIATKLTLHPDVLIIEDFANQPVQLNNVRPR